ncbi:hypothetical protein LTR85_002155 [Meristemomyces frigidus]|nr:hypothetical protein LTR85_002155 [Meristemomyces frigidus]
MASNGKLFLHDHPVSSYAQKIRIALREKNIGFDSKHPLALALEDNGFKIFDSTVILGYLEDKFPEPPLLPNDPKERAIARMIEELCDTQYEAVNWAYGEVEWCKRATGELAEKLIKQVQHQTATILSWLSEKLGDKDYFNGDSFGYADLCVAPVLNRSVYYGFGPAEGTALQRWHIRIQERSSVKQTFAEMAEGAKTMSSGAMVTAFKDGSSKREYRDHRLEWMVKSGGIDVVLEGLNRNNIRFSWPDAAA